MEHYSFENKSLPVYIKIPIHLMISLFLSIITLRVILLTLDFFNVGSIWLQYNAELGAVLMVLMLCTLLFIFDAILSRLTDTGGILIIFFNTMKEEYDINRYINESYKTTKDELDFIRENFAKDFNPEQLMDDRNALEGIVIPGVVDITAEKLNGIGDALMQVELPNGENATVDDFEKFSDTLKGIKTQSTSEFDVNGFGDFGNPLEGIDFSDEDIEVPMKPSEEISVEDAVPEPTEELPVESVEDAVPEQIPEPEHNEKDLNDISVRLAKISEANAIEIRKRHTQDRPQTHKEALENGNGEPKPDNLREKVLAAYQIKLDAEYDESHYKGLAELKKKQMEL